MVTDYGLKGEYQCNIAKKVASKVAIFDIFEVAIAPRVKFLLRRLREAGFYELWQNLATVGVDLHYEYTIRRNASLDSNHFGGKRGDFISFTNLLSFAIFVGALFLVFVVLWGYRKCRHNNAKPSKTKVIKIKLIWLLPIIW
jgi:hypothetical protein